MDHYYLSNLASATTLSCISVNNEAHKARPEIVKIIIHNNVM